MKEALPWFPCNPTKLLGALAGMKPTEGYVYVVMLLRIYECNGPCPDTLDAIVKRTGYNRRIVSDAIDRLFRAGRLKREPEGIVNPVAEKVLADTIALRQERVRSGQKGAAARWQKPQQNQKNGHGTANAEPMANDGYLHLQKQVQKEEEDSLFPRGNSAPEVPVVDVRAELFGRGLQAFVRMSGKPIDTARRMLGRWLRDEHDDALAVLRVIEDAERNRVADPIPWIIGALKQRGQNAANRQGGETSKLGYGAIAARIRASRSG